jgi:hypothetical protein
MYLKEVSEQGFKCCHALISIQAHGALCMTAKPYKSRSVRWITELTTVTEKTSTKSPGRFNANCDLPTNEAEKGSVTTPAGTDAGQPAAQVYL